MTRLIRWDEINVQRHLDNKVRKNKIYAWTTQMYICMIRFEVQLRKKFRV